MDTEIEAIIIKRVNAMYIPHGNKLTYMGYHFVCKLETWGQRPWQRHTRVGTFNSYSWNIQDSVDRRVLFVVGVEAYLERLVNRLAVPALVAYTEEDNGYVPYVDVEVVDANERYYPSYTGWRCEGCPYGPRSIPDHSNDMLHALRYSIAASQLLKTNYTE